MKQVKIPLVSPLNTRKIPTASTSGSSGTVGYGIVGAMIVGSTSAISTKDHRLLNVIPEVSKLGDSRIVYLTPRPGFAAHSTPSAGNLGSAVHIWAGGSGAIISAFGATNSTIYSSTSSLGSTTGKVVEITETVRSGTNCLVFMCDNSNLYYYPAAGALTEVTDAEYTPLTVVQNVIHKDSYTFVLTTTGTIVHSAGGDVASWAGSGGSATDTILASMNTDAATALSETGQFIVAFGTESVEWFYNTGNTVGSVLSSARRELGIGCVGARCWTTIRDTLYWIGTSDAGGSGIYRMKGVDWEKFSVPEIDSIMDISGTAAIALQSCQIYGQPLLILRVGIRTWIINVENRIASEWSGAVPLWDRLAGASTGSSLPLYSISATSTSGKVYVVNPTSFAWTDDGNDYPCLIQTMRSDHGTLNRKRFLRAQIAGDTWPSGTLSLSSTDDDYGSWTTHRDVDMTAKKKDARRLGIGRERAWSLSFTPVGPHRLDSLMVYMEPLGS